MQHSYEDILFDYLQSLINFIGMFCINNLQIKNLDLKVLNNLSGFPFWQVVILKPEYEICVFLL